MTIGIVTMVGEQACGLASSTASVVGTEYTCRRDEYEGVGWVTLGLVVIALLAVRLARREKRRQNSYLL
jgi:hypothetical protein